MWFYIVILTLCGPIAASELTTEPMTPSPELTTLLANNTESSTSQPTSEFTTEHLASEFSTEKQTSEFSTWRSTSEFTTEQLTSEFTTAQLSSEFTTAQLTSEFTTAQLTSEFTTAPLTSEFTTAPLTSEFTTAQLSSEFSTEQQTSQFSTSEFSTGKPTSEFSSEQPTSEVPTPTDSKLSTMPSQQMDSSNFKLSMGLSKSESGSEHEETAAEASESEGNANFTEAAEHKTERSNSEIDYRRTVIFIKKITSYGEAVFLRGGVGVEGRHIPIQHRALDIREPTPRRDAWAVGDGFLDWDDHPEINQMGVGDGGEAKGTPAQWTTNRRDGPYFHPLNSYGDHYWVVDVMMDCSKTENGFFEFKGIMQDKRWEDGSKLDYQCKGMGSLPRSSINHFALCGKLNVFFWGTGDSCEAKDFL
ncbi:alpha-amylase [Elysia marginata]|uniref:Alpha-amylase n=1 Tax=Elysia marginata TaxID=1093978 RepID=A0AAV4H143_9GAST|nr:alpha-amylase [Elysia marginata]